MTGPGGLALAIDVGGTKMAAGLVAMDGTVYRRRVGPTAAVTDGGLSTVAAERVWRSLASVVEEMSAAAGGAGVLGVGVGSAGPIDVAAGTVSPVNIPAWRRFPLLDRLAELVTGVPVRLAGDGMCAAAGEHWRGAGSGVDDLLVLVVSTGVGGGLVQGGRLVAGPTGNAGHVGHMVVDLDGDACPCGGRGCVEAIASGPSMVSWAVRNGWRPAAGRTPVAVDLAGAARSGDPVAQAAFVRAGRALGAGIVSAAAVCDLSRVVVGGGVGQAADLLLPPLRAAIAAHARLGFLRDLAVEPARLGVTAGLVGAAALVFAPDTYPTPAP